jgi:hypothetical protein
MKTILRVEIDTPAELEIYPEEGTGDEDYVGAEKQKELKEFRQDYAKQLHDAVVKQVKDYMDVGFEDDFFDGNEEVIIEGMEDLDDYKIKIKVEEVPK